MFFDLRPHTPLGRVEFAGHLKDTWRTFDMPMRMLNCYAIVFVLEGGGRFVDGLGTDVTIEEGDLVLLFPDIPHKYGPASGKRWSELYAHFDGPIFDLCRTSGILDPARPVCHMQDAAYWRRHLEFLLVGFVDGNQSSDMLLTSRFLTILIEMVLSGVTLAQEDDLPRWLQSTLILLNPRHDRFTVREMAQIAGLPYHTFLRRFKAIIGMSPADYRNARKIEAAKSLLAHTNITINEIASSLQFTDAFHFSNKFKAEVGIRPSEYRRQLQDTPHAEEQSGADESST